MRWIAPLILLACGGPNSKIGSECDAECPEGTRLSSYEAVLSGQGVQVVGTECEVSCETIVPCGAPNVPLITSDGNYACVPLEGYASTIPAAPDVDFGWADQWVQP